MVDSDTEINPDSFLVTVLVACFNTEFTHQYGL